VLAPVLPRNRAAFDRVVRWKRVVPAIILLVVAASVFILPTDFVPWLSAVALALIFGTFVVCEVQKTRIFARDLRERRTQGDASSC
jgi:hypothetical protein